MKGKWSTVALIGIFLIGLSILLYPAVSNYINEKNQSKAIFDYDMTISSMTEEDFSHYFEEANEYNDRLRADPMAFYNPALVDGYDKTLAIDDTGIIGYLYIESLQVSLPIYHDTKDLTLQTATGHLKGTSFPVGGVGTHSVIVGHRGLPRAKLFTNLDKLKNGDIFTITILNRVLTYEVDQIRIVLPDETEELQTIPGEDQGTLLTCTPYGINTHRLLVRGKRITNIDVPEEMTVVVTADAFEIDPLVVTPIVAAPMLVVLFIILLIGTSRKKKNRVEEYLKKVNIVTAETDQEGKENEDDYS